MGFTAVRKNKEIIFVLLLALILRVTAISQSLWLDEAISAIAARDFTYKGIAVEFLLADNHPPLYYLMLRFWTQIWGYSELAIRSLTILISLATIFATYKLALLLNHKNKLQIALLTAIFMATSQFFIYYSQEARMYAQTALFAVLAFYFYINTLKTAKNNKAWIGFSVSIALLMFSDYVPIFLLPVFWIYPLVVKQKKIWWNRFLVSHISLVVLAILWWPIFKLQLESGKFLLSKFPQWKSVAGGASVKNALLVWAKFSLGRISMFNKKLYFLFVGLISIPLLIGFYKAVKKSNYLIFMWLVLPLVFGFLISIYFPAFIYFRFVYLIPAFYLLVVIGLFEIKSKVLRNILVATILVFNLGSFVYYIKVPSQQREQWRQVVEFLESKAERDSLALFEFPEPFAPYLWYENGVLDSAGATNSISADAVSTELKTRELVKSKTIVYYFEYLRDLSDPGRVVEATLNSEGFEVQEIYSNFNGIGFIYKWQKNI